MKILLITEFFPSLDDPVFSGGVEARMYNTALYLAQNHNVVVLCRRKEREPREENLSRHLLISRVACRYRGSSLKIIRLGGHVGSTAASISSIFSRVWFVFQLLYFGSKEKADIVEGSNFVVAFPAFVIGMILGIPRVVWYPDTLKGQWIQQFGWILGSIGEMVESLLLRLPWQCVITISEPVKRKLIAYGVDEDSIRVIGCGINRIQNATYKNLKKIHQLIIVSRLVASKRVDWGIELMKELRKKNQAEFQNLKLLIVGSGPQKKTCKEKIDKFGLTDVVSIQQNMSQKALYTEIAQSKLLLHPSVIEGFGIVLVEAAALGTPFVAADIPTSQTLVEALQSGLCFNKDKIEDFTHMVEYLLTHEKQYETLRKAGIQNSKHYDWDRFSKQTETVYQDML